MNKLTVAKSCQSMHQSMLDLKVEKMKKLKWNGYGLSVTKSKYVVSKSKEN